MIFVPLKLVTNPYPPAAALCSRNSERNPWRNYTLQYKNGVPISDKLNCKMQQVSHLMVIIILHTFFDLCYLHSLYVMYTMFSFNGKMQNAKVSFIFPLAFQYQ